MAEATSTKAHGKKGSQSISRHPLFPAIVALWFAALLGLGSFLVKPASLETFVTTVHIDAIIHAATPPLGTTARLMLALIFGAIGGAIGFVVATRLGGRPPKPAPQVLKMSDVEEPLPWPSMPELRAPEPSPEQTEQNAVLLDPASLAGDSQPDAPIEEPAASLEPAASAPPVPLTAAQRIASADLADLSHVELIERLAIALSRREQRTPLPATDNGAPVVHFPDFSDRQSARSASSSMPPAPETRQAPQQTERALRDALSALQRMSSKG